MKNRGQANTRLGSTRVVVAALVGACCTCCGPPNASQIIETAVGAVGGRAAIEAAQTLVIEGEGDGHILGQGTEPDGSLPYKITSLKRAIDFANARWRQEEVITPLWAAQNPAPQKQVTAFDRGVAYDVDADGTAARAADVVARERETEMHHSPLGILRAAVFSGAAVSNYRRVGNDDVVDVQTTDNAAFTLTVDGTTGLPRKVASRADDPNLGDITVETEFGSYQQAGGLTLPTLITSRFDGHTRTTIRVSRNLVNMPVGNLAAPAAVATAGAASPPTVTADVLAPGVWLLGGESHHSVVVEFADHLLLIEAPMDDARTLAVIAKARALRPQKPLTHVVCTHHHSDHSGGVRAAVSEGLTVIAHERSRRFLEDAVSRPHTMAPDTLARKPHALKLETVATQVMLADATRTVQLYSADSPHATTMLVTYLPREQLLVEVDLYTPPPPNAPPLVFPNAPYLLRLVESQNLRVDRVVSLHRQIVPFADLVAAARQTRAASPEP